MRWTLALLCLWAANSLAQAPATTPDPSPLYVVTYVDLKPTAKSDGAALLRSWREVQRKAPGNLRAEVVQSSTRPGQFVVLAAWKNKAAYDAQGEAAAPWREKLQALRNSPLDDRFHSGFAVGELEAPRGALYVVTHVDVIPPRRDDTEAALKALAPANRAASGNVRYEVLQQTNRPNHFTVVETWSSRQAFDANGMSAHQREFRDKLAPMAGALYDERLYEFLE